MKHAFYSPAKNPYEKFIAVNSNPANTYHSGYEDFMKMIPVVEPDDPAHVKGNKVRIASAIMMALGDRLLFDQWILEADKFPKEDQLIRRTILAIDENTGAEIVMVHYNIGETPLHGHGEGLLMDALVFGFGTMSDYELVDVDKRLVQLSYANEYTDLSLMEADYFSENKAYRSALIHKFETHEKSITLNFVPEHPRDGNGNTFTEI